MSFHWQVRHSFIFQALTSPNNFIHLRPLDHVLCFGRNSCGEGCQWRSLWLAAVQNVQCAVRQTFPPSAWTYEHCMAYSHAIHGIQRTRNRPLVQVVLRVYDDKMADATTPPSPSAPTNFEFEDDGTRPTLFRTVTRSTISTMATADTFQDLGAQSGICSRRGATRSKTFSQSWTRTRLRRRGPDAHGASASANVYGALRRTATISTISTNATADNLPGPGRNVGLLFGWIGGHLEVRLGRVMSHRGYGPDAVADTLARVRRHHRRPAADFYSPLDESGSASEPRRKAERKKCWKTL